MSDLIPIQALRRNAEGKSETPDGWSMYFDEWVRALVEAVEAAHEVAGAPFGMVVARDFYVLRERLDRFDFGVSR